MKNLPSQSLLIKMLNMLKETSGKPFHKKIISRPTLSQHFIQQPWYIIQKQFPQLKLYFYIDGILLADSHRDTLEKMFNKVKRILSWLGIQIAPEKFKEEFISII